MKRLLPVALAVLIFAGLATAQVIVRAGGASTAAMGCASIADGGIVCAGNQTFPPGIKTFSQQVNVGPGGASTDAGFTTSGPSGSNAYGTSVNGARYDFGAGANDYCSSDGTTVTFAGAVGLSSDLKLALDAGTPGMILTSNGNGLPPYWSTGQLLSDGGTLTTEPLTATFPLCIYDDGGTVNLSLSLDGGPCP